MTRNDSGKHERRGTRGWIAVFLTALWLGLFGAESIATAAGESGQLRVIGYNIYKGTFWPKENDRAKAALERGQFAERLAMELALYEPDIICFSESPSEAVMREVARLLGMHHVRFPSAGQWPGTLLSRFEVIEAENVPILEGERPADLFTRHWGRAVLRLPNNEHLIVHSAHFFPRPENTPVRLREIAMMLASMEADIAAGKSLLLVGDLNHTPDMPEYAKWMEHGWVDTFEAVGQGDGNTVKADNPWRRIDYVMANGPIADQLTESRPLYEGAFRRNPDDPGSFALSDHLPQLAVFELSLSPR